MRRTGHLLLLGALAALSGCVAPGPATSPPGAEDAPLVVPWEIVDCTFVAFSVPVPAERLAPYLPEGFTPGVGRRAPVDPVGATETAFLGLEAFECGSGAGLDAPVLQLDYGSFFTFVQPPDALRNDTIEEYYVKWDVLVPDAPRRDALAARGVPARAGDAEVELTRAASGVQVRASLTLDGVGGFTLAGAGTERGPAEGFEFIEYAPAAGGTLAAWHGFSQDRSAVSFGNGVVEIAPGTWIEEVVGGPRAAVTWSAGTWTFLDGAVTHPVTRIGDVR